MAAFAADNLLSGYQHPSGPLSNDLSYVVPNDATASIPVALAGLKEDIQAENTRLQELIEAENTRLQAENTRLQAENTRLQEENILAFASIVLLSIDDPNDVVSAVSAYQGLTFTQAIELMLADARYYNQFPKLYTEGYVANRMAQLGIFDLSKNSASADSDNDSQSNLYELALGSNPINALDTVPPLTVTQEDTGFIVRYIQIDPATTPSDLVISVDSSLNLLAWSTAAASIASDQSNVPAGYIRYELLIDAAAQPNLYIRVGVN